MGKIKQAGTPPIESLPDEHGEFDSARLDAISSVLCLLVAGGAILVLIGWGGDIRLLTRWLPDQVAMNPLSAVTFLLAGASLWLHLRPSSEWTAAPAGIRPRHLARFCAGIVVLASVLKLVAFAGGWDTEIHQVLFAGKLDQDHLLLQIRMAPKTALCSVLLGLALMLLTRNGQSPGRPWIDFLTLPVLLLSMLALIGYAYGVRQLYYTGGLIPMALPTALLLHLLVWGILCAQPDRGFMKTLTSDGPGGTLARRLFPAMIVTIGLLGWLRLEGEQRGFYAVGTGVALYTSANIVIFAMLIWWSARKLQKAEASRRRSDAAFERFFTLSLDMLCIAGSDGYFKRLNPAFSQTLGYTTRELLARPFLDFVHPDDREATTKVAAKLSEGEPALHFENRYQCRDGSWKWLSWKAHTIAAEGLLYATARDVTEAKQSEAAVQKLNSELHHQASQLQEANRELESFSYSVSHDLRAPLRHVLGYVEMLVKACGDQLAEKPRRYLNTIREATEEMGQLIDDLLAFSRVGRTDLSKKAVSMDALVLEAIEDLELETRDRNIAWDIAPLPQVVGDRAMLKQVMANLIGNAVKYTRGCERARIEIGCEPKNDGEVVFFVRDNGVGFDMSYVHKLFGVFQRLHRTDEFEGTGIGLAIVRRIVARHGGQTWAEGAPGQGATFSFTLRKSKLNPRVPVLNDSHDSQSSQTNPPGGGQPSRQGAGDRRARTEQSRQ